MPSSNRFQNNYSVSGGDLRNSVCKPPRSSRMHVNIDLLRPRSVTEVAGQFLLAAVAKSESTPDLAANDL